MAIDPVPFSLLESLASEFHNLSNEEATPRKKQQDKASVSIEKESAHTFDLASWILRHIPNTNGPRPYGNDGHIWVLTDCFFRPGDGQTMFIIQHASGAISAGCQHDTCPGSKSTGNHWLELREHFEGPRLPIDTNLDRDLSALPRTEYGLAERFRMRFGDQVRFVESWGGKWLVYNGRCWDQSDCAAEIYAQESIHALRREAWHLKEDDLEGDQKEEKDCESGISEMGNGVPAGEFDEIPTEVSQQPSCPPSPRT